MERKHHTLVIAANYKQFRYWCNQNKTDYRKYHYVGTEYMVHGYSPDSTTVVVLYGLTLDDWKYEQIKRFEALGFDIQNDYT